jgi:hypothetical protein
MRNPANFWQTHKQTCPTAEPGSEITREQVNSSLTTSAVRRLTDSTQRGVQTFTLSASQIDSFTSGIVKAIVTGNIAFTFVENPHLMDAMSAVGVPTISRKQLANLWIPKLAEEASVATVATLEKALLVDASSDGWRKKYCEQGASLNNIVALLPERAYFHDAVNCSSMRKDAESIANFLTTAAKSIVGSTDDAGWMHPQEAGVAPVYSAAYCAAFAVDPCFADVEDTSHGSFCCAPVLDDEHMQAAESVIERVGGRTAATQFTRLFSQGYPKKMQSVVAGLALQRQHDGGSVLLGSKRTLQEVPAAADRIRVWRKFGDSMPEL